MDGPADVFIWKVTAISLFSCEVDEAVQSPIFQGTTLSEDLDNPTEDNSEDLSQKGLDGTQWQLLFYPKGDESPDHISLYLKRVDKNSFPVTFHAQFRLCFVDTDGNDRLDVCWKEGFKNGTSLGLKQMVSRQELLEDPNPFLSTDMDKLIFKCQIRKCEPCHGQPHSVSVLRSWVYDQTSTFHWQLKKFTDLSEDAKAVTRLAFSKHLVEVRCYPSEYKGKSQLMVDFQLLGDDHQAGADQQLFLKAKISLVDPDLKVRLSKTSKHLFSKSGESWLFKPLVRMEKLLKNKSSIFPDDVLKLRFELRASDGTVDSGPVASLTPQLPPKLVGGTTLGQDLDSQEQSRLFPDIGLEVEGEIFYAHKSILAQRSPVFRRKLKELHQQQQSSKHQEQAKKKETKNKTSGDAYFLSDTEELSEDEATPVGGIFQRVQLTKKHARFIEQLKVLILQSPKKKVGTTNKSYKEDNMKHVEPSRMFINDVDKQSMKLMLKFLYTDTVDSFDFGSGFKLYSAARKYDIPLLKSKCVSVLKTKLSVDTAVRSMVLAQDAQDKDLMLAAVKLVISNTRVLFSRDWLIFGQINKKLADLVWKLVSDGTPIKETPKKKAPIKCNIIVKFE